MSNLMQFVIIQNFNWDDVDMKKSLNNIFKLNWHLAKILLVGPNPVQISQATSHVN